MPDTTETRGPARVAVTAQAPVTSELHDAWHAFALNSEHFTSPVRALLMPTVKRELWDEYVEAVGDIWDLNHGDDPFRYCPEHVDWRRFSTADARAFALDERAERRDAALARILDAVGSAAPDREAP